MKTLYIILGQTATGKTELSISLAKKIDGEIVSADSRQVYIGMDIGTAKITTEEMNGVPHHMIDIADPCTETYTVADYVRDGRKVLNDIWSRKKTPVIVGGTGMYIDALVGRITLDGPAPDPEFREELESQELDQLLRRLENLDTDIYDSIDQDNKVRVVRAIERLELPAADYSDIIPFPGHVQIHWIGLRRDMGELRDRIHQRNVQRLENGLVEEVRGLHEKELSWERMERLGLEYRYVGRYIRGEINDIDELIYILDTKTNQYAKRQMTWFRKNQDIQWHNPDTAE